MINHHFSKMSWFVQPLHAYLHNNNAVAFSALRELVTVVTLQGSRLLQCKPTRLCVRPHTC